MESSPLSLLPAELRSEIWGWTFTTPYAVTLQAGLIQHALTRTCRQIRGETLAMYYSMARFNAHLDDGPATPLATWMQRIGPEHVLRLREVNVWDMHMLNATLHGQESTAEMLRSRLGSGHGARREHYVLLPVGSWLLSRGWYLNDLVIALFRMGLDLLRFNIMDETGLRQETSYFAVLPIAEVAQDQYARVGQLASRLGFSEMMIGELIRQLKDGEEEIRFRDARRDLVLKFNELELVWMKQEYDDLMRIVL